MEPVVIAGATALAGLLSLMIPAVRRAVRNQALSRRLGPMWTIGALSVDSSDKKLAVMEWDLVWEPAIPLAPTTPFSAADIQQMLWGYPGIVWSTLTGSDNEQMALMEWGVFWEPGFPMTTSVPFSQADQQQLLWGYPGVLWVSEGGGVVTLVRGPNLGKCLIKVPPAM